MNDKEWEEFVSKLKGLNYKKLAREYNVFRVDGKRIEPYKVPPGIYPTRRKRIRRPTRKDKLEVLYEIAQSSDDPTFSKVFQNNEYMIATNSYVIILIPKKSKRIGCITPSGKFKKCYIPHQINNFLSNLSVDIKKKNVDLLDLLSQVRGAIDLNNRFLSLTFSVGIKMGKEIWSFDAKLLQLALKSLLALGIERADTGLYKWALWFEHPEAKVAITSQKDPIRIILLETTKEQKNVKNKRVSARAG